MAKSDKHIMVHWIEENKFSITRERYVTDKRMMDDSERVGLIEYREDNKKKPRTGWPVYMAKVLASSSKLIIYQF